MIFNGRYCLETNKCEVQEAEWQTVNEAIQDFKNQKEGYIVLVPIQDKKKYEYLKVYKEKELENTFILETSIEKDEELKTYRLKTKFGDTVTKLFSDFHSFQTLPNVTEWKDINPSNFELQINGDIISDFDLGKIEDSIVLLEDQPKGFVILSTIEPIQGSTFIQTAYPEGKYDDGNGYIIEINKEENGKWKFYRYRTINVMEVIRMFNDFYTSKKLPNIKNWEDITKELS